MRQVTYIIMGNEIFRYLRKYFRGLALWKDLSTIPHNQIQSNKTLLKIECNTALKARTNYMFCAGFFHLIGIWIRQRVYYKNKTIRVP
ncbi:hypothetical protein BN177_450049 [Clostridioides difficile E24]|nr:hypothetical protein BN177_450049 [Clostridioides difficile E24]CCL44628.1 hypothetical protein BN178_170021 [Clostridioides difficile T42]CCL51279.1 hypothetical protein BN179_3130002 [Clostridioides difficile T6]CCL55246.1 hypothetical protein BN180_2740002 [Clostridioides difficile E14]CCL59311.1 hypothetical protein BN181_4340007 [Clostridioides difficile T17]